MSLDFVKTAVLSAGASAERRVVSSACAMNKYKTKPVWQSYQLALENHQIIVKDGFDLEQSEDIISSLSRAVIVKPLSEGSRIGMNKVNNERLPARILKFDNKVLPESWINDSEYIAQRLNRQAL